MKMIESNVLSILDNIEYVLWRFSNGILFDAEGYREHFAVKHCEHSTIDTLLFLK